MNQNNGYNQQTQQQDEDEDGNKYEAWMRAGELQVGIEAETGEEACENVKDIWNKALHDLHDMPEEKRNQIGLK